MEVIVIGGGAAGMMAAITAAKLKNRVTVLERAERLGRKLAVTGNGRCNLTNINMSPEHYHGQREFVASVLNGFNLKRTLSFFRRLGLITVSEPSGRVYPHSDQAGSVVDVLRFALSALKVNVITSCTVSDIATSGGTFVVQTDTGPFKADKLIVTCGGAAGTRAGGSRLGYELITGLGHSCTRLYPSLVQIKTENKYTRPLKGVRADASVMVLSHGRTVSSSFGEVQFTDYGLSGPAIFDVSRSITTGGSGLLVKLDLMRELTRDDLKEIIESRLGSGLTMENLLTGTLHNKLGRTVLSRLGYSLSAPVSMLSHDDIVSISNMIKSYELPVTGSLGMDGAQVTAGGIPVEEFNPMTLESRIVPGLFAAGEILDVDGDCGGYNLQWAWSSGHLAGLLGDLQHDTEN